MKNESKPKVEQFESKILNEINKTEALIILKVLADEDENICKKILQITKKHLSEIDIEEVALEIYSELEGIDIEELWANSGASQYGYVEPTGAAWEMVDATVKPFIDNLKRYKRLSLHEEFKRYCEGLLKGLYKFDKESKTQFKDYATDAPMEYFGIILDEWKKRQKSKRDIEEIEKFVKENFPDRK